MCNLREMELNQIFRQVKCIFCVKAFVVIMTKFFWGCGLFNLHPIRHLNSNNFLSELVMARCLSALVRSIMNGLFLQIITFSKLLVHIVVFWYHSQVQHSWQLSLLGSSRLLMVIKLYLVNLLAHAEMLTVIISCATRENHFSGIFFGHT
mgnify:CR=1 FL=1